MKKVIIPTLCFAVLSTIAFEETIQASTVVKATNNSKINTNIKAVDIKSGSNLNLREEPSIHSQILTKLKRGKAVNVYEESNGWAKVSVDGKVGYLSTDFLTLLPTNKVQSSSESTFTKYVNVNAGSHLNVRHNPTTDSKIVSKLSNNTIVNVLIENNGWAKIKLENGVEGFVSTQYLQDKKTVDSIPEKDVNIRSTKRVNVSSNSSLNVRNSPTTNSSIIFKLKKGKEVEVYSESKGWSKIKVDGVEGYVSSQYLEGVKINSTIPEVNKKIIKYVNTDSNSRLNVRSSPSNNASITHKLKRGVELQIISESNGWAKIQLSGKIGYVSSHYLTSKSDKTQEVPQVHSESGKVEDQITTSKFVNVEQGSSLKMRVNPSTSASVIVKIARGVRVEVLSELNGWAKVNVYNFEGYVKSEFLSLTKPVSIRESQASPKESNHGILNGTIVRNIINYDFSLEQLTNLQMKVNPKTDKKYPAFIREDALVLNNDELPSFGTVNGNSWNVRSGAGTSYKVIGQVKNNQSLQILSEMTGQDGYTWYEIQIGNTWNDAHIEDVKYFLNPDHFSSHPIESLQFLKLSETTHLNINEVNDRILNGRGILAGQAETFIAAGEMYGINEIYLISHALLESGNGHSQLANGVSINGRKVYNMFGIGANDGNALLSGAEYAYKAGWFTPEAAIIGGAEFIARGYIDAGQDTIYKMRWNPAGAITNGYALHQYATDIGWASKQVNQIYKLYSLLDAYKMTLEIPQYK
ncbi:SH3 domain-containing protein [Litchfieldia salsa]|uniref:Peptidoglycan hydrolases with endo-beta-N-acetylglucosaminidase n=1 Tax=Litchfieldia salsa TaxID=930152 RepID=A0A1H0TGL5_9BACI|nr:SH3 domain-containing protein [Litchfieldia salsa]SDP53203.1 peptidoglycan hydrolases with endo-beta-N-acetylglucosaminidase [Litchfieldia salsa]